MSNSSVANRNPLKDPVIAVHQNITIKLDTTSGHFYTDVGNGLLSDKSLDGLKEKIDARARNKARLAASKLPAVIYEEGSRWDSDAGGKWTEGTFAGVNAHTGDITFQVAGVGKTFGSSAWFFRKGDPAIAAVKELVRQKIAADRVAEAAEQALEKALKAHAFQFDRGWSSRNDKRSQAAQQEAKLIEVLTPPEPAT